MANISLLKQRYLEYYEDVPIQKYAAMAVGRDEDTVLRWKKDDTDFADAVQRAHAQRVRKKVIAVKAEFALERLQKDLFSERQEINLSPAPRPISDPVLRDRLKRAFKDYMVAKIRDAKSDNA